MNNKNNFLIKGFNSEFILESLKENKPIKEIMRQHGINELDIEEWQKEYALNASSFRGEMEDFEYLSAVSMQTNNYINFIDMETREVLFMNRACREIFQVPEDEYYKYKKCYNVFYGKDAICDFCNFDELEEKGELQWKTLHPVYNRYHLLTDKIINIHNRRVQIEIGMDIQEDVNERIRLDKKVRVDNTLFKCIRALSDTINYKQAIENMLEVVCKFYDGNRGYIFEVDEGGESLSNTYEWCAEGVSPEKDNLQNCPIETAHQWFDMFEEVGTFSISKLTEDNEIFDILDAQGIDSLMAAPLIENGKIKGFLGVDDPREGVEEFSLLTSIAYFIVNDIQKRRFITELEYRSYTDGMTKLNNRNKFILDLADYDKNPPNKAGVVYIDLNGLKLANDEYGHNMGDFLLIRLADTIKNNFTESMYRIGGDEFVILCIDMEKEAFYSRVQGLRDDINSQNVISASIGEAWVGKDVNLRELVKYADSLMYANKQVY